MAVQPNGIGQSYGLKVLVLVYDLNSMIELLLCRRLPYTGKVAIYSHDRRSSRMPIIHLRSIFFTSR